MEKRIVWITPDYYFDTDSKVVPELKKYYDLSWFVVFGKNTRYRVGELEKECIPIFLNYRYRDIRVLPKYISLIKRIRKIKPTIIYNGFLGLPFFLPLLFGLNGKQNVLYEGHEVDPYVSANHDKLSVEYSKFNLRNVGHVHVFSKHSEKEFRRLYPGKECTYIPMAPKEYGKPAQIINHKGEIVFLFFGGLRSTKRFDVLLNAFLSLDETYSRKAELWVYGNCDGKEKENYLEMIEGHNNIKTMFDFVPDDMIPNLFSSASYLVLPYQQITQSGPMMIAYNYNLPMIATDLDGFKERIIDGENGYLFKRNDVDDLKRVLIHCINQPADDYQRIKDNAKTFAEREYSLNVIIEKYREMLDLFIAKNERR